jgi:hypothetical protein
MAICTDGILHRADATRIFVGNCAKKIWAEVQD